MTRTLTAERLAAFREAVQLDRECGRRVEVLHEPWEEPDGSGWWAVVYVNGERRAWRWVDDVECWI